MPAKGQFKKNAKKRSVQQRAYKSTPWEKKRRAKRNKARRKALREGKVKKGSKVDVHHSDRKGLSPSSTRLVHRSKNRQQNNALRSRRRRR